jgi:hypothetical protein
MAYFKYIPYLFLVFALLFLVDAISKYNAGEDATISFLFVGVGIFMFFFRRWSYKKFNNTDSDK